MITDKELLELNSLGFILGPEEDEEHFGKRVKLSKEIFLDPDKAIHDVEGGKIKKPLLGWVRAQLLNLYDFSPENFFGFFSNKNLSFFQGAATWQMEKEGIKLPLVQLRKNMKKGSYLGIYKMEEILTHEAVHAARITFKEPIFEECFAYLTSTSSFRRIFGPIVRYSWEGWFFVSSLFCSFLFNWFFLFFDKVMLAFFSSLCIFLSFSLMVVGLVRLLKTRIIFKKTYKRLDEITNKALAVMVRLSDGEIKMFSKMKSSQIYKYIAEESEKSLRFKIIYLAYFVR